MATGNGGGGGGFAQWNCRGLRDKTIEFQEWLGKEKPDIMILNETGFPLATPLRVKNYIDISAVGVGKWGTSILVHKNITYKKIYQSGPEKECECIVIEATVRGEKVTVVGSYWPDQYKPRLEDWIRIMSMREGYFLLIGDFNAHHEGGWNSYKTNERGRVLMGLVEECDLQIHGEGTTYRKPGQRQSNIDLGFTSAEWGGPWVRKIGDDPMASDHLPWTLRNRELTQRSIVRRPNWKKFRDMTDQRLEGTRERETTDSIEEEAVDIAEQVVTSLRLASSEVKVQKGDHAPFWSGACQTRVNHNRAAYRRWNKSGRLDYYVKYREIQGQSKKFLKKRKREGYQEFANQVNDNCTTGGAWRILKGMKETESRPTAADTMILNNSPMAETQRKGENFFEKIFQQVEEEERGTEEIDRERESEEVVEEESYGSEDDEEEREREREQVRIEEEVEAFENAADDDGPNDEERGEAEREEREVERERERERRRRETELRERLGENQRAREKLWASFTMDELRWALKQTANTAPGEDGLTAQMLKSLSPRGLDRILEVLNKSRETGEVPRAWKRGKIILLPKPGRDLKDFKNWRPICLTSVLGKILERLINRRLMWHLEASGYFLEQQHGFRWNRSTQDALA